MIEPGGSRRTLLFFLMAVLSLMGTAEQATPASRSSAETDAARLTRIIEEYWHYPLLGTFYARYLAGEKVDLPDISEAKANSDAEFERHILAELRTINAP